MSFLSVAFSYCVFHHRDFFWSAISPIGPKQYLWGGRGFSNVKKSPFQTFAILVELYQKSRVSSSILGKEHPLLEMSPQGE
jgi:hypothetical protein